MKTRAIIVKKQNTNEHDQLITCYTQEYGKLTAIAKSILKPNSIQAMHLDILNLVSFELVSGRGTPIITGAQVEKQYPVIKNNLPRLAVAYFFLDVLGKMVFDNDKDPEMWNFLDGAFDNLNSSSEIDAPNFLRQKQSEFLKILGYFPQLGRCAVCSDIYPEKGRASWALNFNLGATVCGGCFLRGYGGILLQDEDWQILSGQGGLGSISSKSILDSLFEYLAEDKLGSLDLIKQAFNTKLQA